MTDIENLSHRATDVKPVNVAGWHEHGDDDDNPSWWEAFNYERDDQDDVTLVASDGTVCGIVVDGEVITDYDDYREAFDPYLSEDGDLPEWALTESEFNDILTETDPYSHGAEGPMMNYWYPLEYESDTFGGNFDPMQAAAKLIDLPLCVVEVDGHFGLALTGGGMDLSWEICAAYITLGLLPPTHFSDLPRMADRWDESKQLVVDAMKAALQGNIKSLQYRLERLAEIPAWYEREGLK